MYFRGFYERLASTVEKGISGITSRDKFPSTACYAFLGLLMVFNILKEENPPAFVHLRQILPHRATLRKQALLETR